MEDMSIGNLKPVFVLTLDRELADFCRHASRIKNKREPWSPQVFWEASYISEFAFHDYFEKLGIRHRWVGIYFGKGDEAPPNFILYLNGKQTTAGVRSRRHKDLEDWADRGAKLVIFYPTDRCHNPTEEIGEYTIAASLRTNDDRSSTIAFWGAIRRQRLVKLLNTLPVNVNRKTGQRYSDIPLEEFNPSLLELLILSAGDAPA